MFDMVLTEPALASSQSGLSRYYFVVRDEGDIGCEEVMSYASFC